MNLLCYCRTGFEPELAAELTERAASAGHAGYARTQRQSGWVEFVVPEDIGAEADLPFEELIFARQKLAVIADLPSLDPRDRLSPMLAAMEPTVARAQHSLPFGDVWVEHPDTEEGKPLAGLARSFANALRPALRKRAWMTPAPEPTLPRLHVVVLAGDHRVQPIR